MNSSNIASYLPEMAANQAETLAVVMQTDGDDSPRYTYRELNEVSDVLARGLQEIGIVKGTRTVLMVTPGLDFFALAFALFKLGAVMIAVDPGMGVKNLGTCLQEAEAEAFIGVRRAHMARILYGWAKTSLKINVVVEARLFFGTLMTDLHELKRLGAGSEKVAMNEVDAEDAAAILFTSGSTGVPKGVCYTHANFSAQLGALKKLYEIQPGEIDLATFPLFALFAPALGMTSIIPDMDFTRPGEVNAESIIHAIEKYEATTMFGSPALLNRVGRWGVERGKRLPRLKRVISAGAPVSAAVIQRFSRLLEKDIEIFTPYGATEALPVASIGGKEVMQQTGRLTGEGRGVCVGLPVPGIDLKIVAITDEAIENWGSVNLLETNEVGEIAVKGAQVSEAYYNCPSSNELSKIKDADGGFYHRMGDLAYLDEQGRVWFCGRKSERVVIEKEIMYTTCCEGVFNTNVRVLRSALVKIHVESEVQPALCVELEADSQHTDQRVLIQELLDIAKSYKHTAMIKHILIHPAFPIDIRHNAKIGRAELGEWAEQQI